MSEVSANVPDKVPTWPENSPPPVEPPVTQAALLNAAARAAASNARRDLVAYLRLRRKPA